MMLTWDLLLVPVFLAVFITLHELGHIAAAKALNLYLQKVGFSMTPFPHVFVNVAWPKKKKERTLYLMSGFITIVTLLLLILLFDITSTPLLIAFGIQLVIETNPIYSDFVIINLTEKVSAEIARSRQPYKTVYQRIYANYLYSPAWYVHFILWVVFIVLIVQLIKNYIP